MAGHGIFWQGRFGLGIPAGNAVARQARSVVAARDWEDLGMAGKACHRSDRKFKFRFGVMGQRGQGPVWHGETGSGPHGWTGWDGRAPRVRQGSSEPGLVRLGEAGCDATVHIGDGLGKAGTGGLSRNGAASRGAERSGGAGVACPRYPGGTRSGTSRQAWIGPASPGTERIGAAGGRHRRTGWADLGVAGQARNGLACLCLVWHGGVRKGMEQQDRGG